MKVFLHLCPCYLLLLIFFASSCNNYNHNITADISGLKDDKVIVYAKNLSTAESKITIDTIKAHKGRIAFNVTFPLNHIVIVPEKFAPKDSSIPSNHAFSMEAIISPADKSYAQGKLSKDGLEYNFDRKGINNDFSTLRNSYLPSLKSCLKLKKELDSIYKSGRVTPTFPTQKKMQLERDTIYGSQLNYMASHLKSQLSGFLLLGQSRDIFLKCYEKTSPEVKNGLFKILIDLSYADFKAADRLDKMERQIRTGMSAPIFTLKTPESKKISLNEINGEYILLDFWETWCTPSIKAFPKLKKYEKKYKNHLKIVSILCNDNKKVWKKIIKENHLSWLNLEDIPNSEYTIKDLYAISGYPTRILLNKNKKIAFKFVGESNLFYDTLDKTLNPSKL